MKSNSSLPCRLVSKRARGSRDFCIGYTQPNHLSRHGMRELQHRLGIDLFRQPLRLLQRWSARVRKHCLDRISGTPQRHGQSSAEISYADNRDSRLGCHAGQNSRSGFRLPRSGYGNSFHDRQETSEAGRREPEAFILLAWQNLLLVRVSAASGPRLGLFPRAPCTPGRFSGYRPTTLRNRAAFARGVMLSIIRDRLLCLP